jgi:hypothetical protein
VAVVSLNVVYIWVRKEPQFRERSAPTFELIRILNDTEGEIVRGSPITICGFPLDPWIGREAVIGFTPLKEHDFGFRDVCNESVPNALRWNEERDTYTENLQAAGEVR